MVISFLSFLENAKRYSKHTLVAYHTDLMQFQGYCLSEGLSDIAQASRIETRGWLIKLSQEGIEAKTVARKQACLRSFFTYLVREGHRTQADNPMLKLPSPRIPKRNPQFFSTTQMAEMVTPTVTESETAIELSQEAKSPFAEIRDRLIIELLYGTGMRLAELVSLTNDSYNKDSRTLRILGKRNKERVVPIHPALAELLATYFSVKAEQVANSSANLLVTDKGKPIYPVFVQRLVSQRAINMRNVEQRSPHTIRHSFATHLLDAGADINAIKELLGHNSLAATQVYTHNSLSKLKEAYSKAHPRTAGEKA